MSNEEKAKQESPVIKWDDKDMQTSYANVSNVAVTQDEVMMLFGTSQVWNNSQDEIDVSLSNRVIMTHSAAKRFLLLLTKTLSDYEKGQKAMREAAVSAQEQSKDSVQ
ncbi:DUF3467 domain-containing protein [Oceanospirillum maris]|uniref:DUF3467 domain-containing protein n=1 Tax=Oceanospirillum maris TaxID=64977 RepID=UPI00040EA191|nr:DUF3467 domain-containing protein [Oceanospirillum maris]